MEWQLAILLALVSLIIIGFIYFDAKRRSNVRKERIERELYQERLAKSKDKSGFDDDGIGQVRVVNKPKKDVNNEHIEELLEPEIPEPKVQQSATPQNEVVPEEEAGALDEVSNHTNMPQQEPIEPTISESDIPVLDDALFEFTKESLRKEPPSEKASKTEPSVEQPQQTSLFDEPEDEPTVEVEPELIFSLFVVAEQDKPFQGPELVQTLVEQGMRHGEMDIFHRHAQANGRGAVQFSLANAFEPGVFDLKKVDDLETRGLALFMALPGPKKPMQAYELMVKTARGIVQELGGFVLDASKSNFSKQIESHHKEQIIEFERKQLLNK
ncbi:cell division protein ZipA [Kangiella sediminilitoris]|uniref:Cell division protein ZipA n=1 Tax=Kangiella sediminilitoris TaxID=1144748 RepID=A0A1B3BAG4_9GAMM|nr:cell division protein ZipA [Kangiella sediminilitoris]AOE49787.1 Cell division protein ZipA [Kangiella sediminilitoris]